MSQKHQQEFLESALATEALIFGEFTLKSGRKSPYFFNMGRFCSGEPLSKLATAYAESIIEQDLQFDVIFGPAYKGIPLCAIVVMKLYEIGGDKYKHVKYSFNRKEAKDHGEGGNIVGSPLVGQKVLIIDDCITAGTAIREAIDMIKQQGGDLTGVIIALDRQETTVESDMSATQIISKESGVPVMNIVGFKEVAAYLKDRLSAEQNDQIEKYISQYAPKDF